MNMARIPQAVIDRIDYHYEALQILDQELEVEREKEE